MAEYTILKPPPKRHGLAWLCAGVVVVLIAVGVGAFLIGRHDAAAPARPGHGGTTRTTGGADSVVTPLAVTSTTPASGAVDVAGDQTRHRHVLLAHQVRLGPADLQSARRGTWQRVRPDHADLRGRGPVHSDERRRP